ncbi:MAG: hypothetical protein KDC45_10015 [Bacteroidetes bacterium]|nr:hypothetical protein [Bacteroidota bacterium]
MTNEDPTLLDADGRPPVTLGNELLRKLIHMASLGIPIGYKLTDQGTALVVVGGLLVFAILLEYGRMASSTVNYWFIRFVGKMLREEETGSYSGATYLLLASFLSILVFHQDIAVLCLLFLIVGDSTAALVGRRFGKMHVFGKTVEGTLAFITVALVIALFFPAIPAIIRLGGVIVAALAELMPSRVNDNLRIPVVAGSIMEILYVQYLKELPPILIEGGRIL